MHKRINLILFAALATLNFGAHASMGEGKQTMWGGKCKAQECTISGTSATLKVKKNGDSKSWNVVAEGCVSKGAFGAKVEFCGKGGVGGSTSDTVEVRTESKHTWSYTYKNGDNIKIVTDGKKTESTIIKPTTKGTPGKPAGWGNA